MLTIDWVSHAIPLDALQLRTGLAHKGTLFAMQDPTHRGSLRRAGLLLRRGRSLSTRSCPAARLWIWWHRTLTKIRMRAQGPTMRRSRRRRRPVHDPEVVFVAHCTAGLPGRTGSWGQHFGEPGSQGAREDCLLRGVPVFSLAWDVVPGFAVDLRDRPTDAPEETCRWA